MPIDIKVPPVGESINEVTLVKWLKAEGEWADRDDVIAELESEKATFEINAEQAGAVHHIASEGDTLEIGAIVCSIDTEAPRPAEAPTAEATKTVEKEAPVTAKTAEPSIKATPVAAAIIADKKVDTKAVKPTGSNGKIMKQDVLDILAAPGKKPGTVPFSRQERPEKMSNLRKTVSRRLVEAKNATAMLTTFNEVDMGPIMQLRKKYKDKFKELHGVNLGFMSFFAKACCYALQEFPAVNAYIDGDQILYHDYCDISIAVSAPKGLVVPVIRNAESLSMHELESAVIELATKARNNKLTIEEMSGGTFTITNGGVFGSMMSTPIINIPQSAILGMHNIVDRPMAVNGQVVIKPMMYVALSYDHRIIDGR
ncbi:MAG: 2-oxoglutarate dehydrogenase complex dihydrolipoyllysine-residue succinyltransferase, partial [Ferruginibacter sp.]